jgi:hypothetical protein
MDPKMDSGFLEPGETLEDDYDTLAPLLPEELIGIMDQLLCYEMAWHTGYPLSQTLFTSTSSYGLRPKFWSKHSSTAASYRTTGDREHYWKYYERIA